MAATVAAYFSTFGFGFVDRDDSSYVYRNYHLTARVTLHTLRWVVLSFSPDNWFPLTRLSYLGDYKLVGLRAGYYHAENVLIHCAAAVVLLVFLRRATGRLWPSAFVAAVFALHPLHVESVAWVAERKDVLSALFWFASLWAWVRYTEQPGLRRYSEALALFSLGLMSKPMIVTLPCTLVLLDVWPLRRGPLRRRIAEKIPFFALSCGVMALTIAAQRGAIKPMDTFPLPLRLANALVTTAIYIGDTLWPARLWAIHAYPRSVPAWQVIGAAAGILTVSAAALLQRRNRPWLATGWFWFLITLIPVIGLVQTGPQSRADRYMYVPMTGLAILLAWGAAESVGRWPGLRRAAAALGIAACLAMAVRTWQQTQYWKDTDALLSHSLDMDGSDYEALNHLASNMVASNPAGQPNVMTEVIEYDRKAVRLRPDVATVHNNLGFMLCHAGQYEEGMAELREALRIEPTLADAHDNLADALLRTGHPDEAVAEAEAALRLNPLNAGLHNNLGSWLWHMPGRADDAIRHMEEAIRIDPDFPAAQHNLAVVLLNTPGRLADAVAHFAEGVRIEPDSPATHIDLANALDRMPGMQQEAGRQRDEALQLQLNAAPQ